MTAPPVFCDHCLQVIDVTQPHITVVRQFEIQYETGVVTGLDSPVLVAQRHAVCQPEGTDQ